MAKAVAPAKPSAADPDWHVVELSKQDLATIQPDAVRERSTAARRTPRPAFRQFAFLSTALPSLRRLVSRENVTAEQPRPLLVLAFSSISFLSSTVIDERTGESLYVLKTSNATTVILRSDPWNGGVKAADIKWPRTPQTKTQGTDLQWVLIQIGKSRWKSGGDILRPCGHDCHKFHVSQATQSMKWKRVGALYQCVSSAVKGPIATFEPAVGSDPPKIQVYQTLPHKLKTLEHSGVSLQLLDHLLVTALLLVTDVQEWRSFETHIRGQMSEDTVRSTIYDSCDPKSMSSWRSLPATSTFEDTDGHNGDDDEDDEAPANDALGAQKLPPSDLSSDATQSPTDLHGMSFLRLDSSSPSPPPGDVAFPCSQHSPYRRHQAIPAVPRIPSQYRTRSSPQPLGPALRRELPTPPPLRSLDARRRNATVAGRKPLTHSQSTPASPAHTESVYSLFSPSLPSSSSLGHTSTLVNDSSSASLPSGPSYRTNSGVWRRLPRPPVRPHMSLTTLVGDKGELRRGGSRSLPPTPHDDSITMSAMVAKAEEEERLLRSSAMEKEATELADWVRQLAGDPFPLSRTTEFEPPPPAYNSLHHAGDVESGKVGERESGPQV